MLESKLEKSDYEKAAQLRAMGGTVADKLEQPEYGRFGWVMDPDGNRVELWPPPG